MTDMIITHFILNKLQYINHYFITIGTKGVKKILSKVAKGAAKNEGTVWFHELSDKG